jgi:HTH-type transcriptional regulator / antitoxin HigA
MNIKPIRTEKDHKEALKAIERLWDAPAGSAEADQLEVLATLVEVFEREHEPIPPPDPIGALLFRVEQMGHDKALLQAIIGGTRARVSEVLNRRRPLTVDMMRRAVRAGVPAECLLAETTPTRRSH